ncbi:MAG: DMP19 family protein [Planctomycetota bacterium]
MRGYRIRRPSDLSGVEWDVIDGMWDAISPSAKPRRLARALRRATEGQIAIFACTWYEREINNGGHVQFFWNPAGILWPEALDGFERMGAGEHAEILRRAVARFDPVPPARDHRERMEQVRAVTGDLDDDDFEDEVFSDLDDAFYDLQRRSPMSTAFRDHVLGRPEEFFV